MSITLPLHEPSRAKTMSKVWVLLSLLSASIAIASPSSLCSPRELTVFDCDVGSKRLSICASNDLGTKNGTLQYRFGTAEKIELLYPESPRAPVGHFWASSTAYSGGGEFRIRFRNGSHDFLVFDSTTRTGFGASGNKPVFEAGVLVKQKGKPLAIRRCSANTRINSELLALLPEEDFNYDARP